MEFKLEEKQTERAQKFFKEHFEANHKNIREMTGAAVEFGFIPTGLGPSVRVRCLYCQATRSLTLDDDGVFTED